MRNTWTSWNYRAHCQGCTLVMNGKNALGLAAKHHDRTGHSVLVDVLGHVSYLNAADDAAARAAKKGPKK